MTAIRIQKLWLPSFCLILTDPLYKSGLKEEYFSLKIPIGYIPVQVKAPLTSSITSINLAFFSEKTHEIKLASTMNEDEQSKLIRPFDQGVWFSQLPVKNLILNLQANQAYIRSINRGDY